MAVEQHPVQLVGSGAECSQGVFALDEEGDGDLCRLTFRYPGGELTAEASDYFEAMCRIRLDLDKAGWRPACYGASRNVYPSGMCRDMGRGLKAYRVRLGHHPKLDDLVGIFETGPDVEPVSVEEQRRFFDRWLQSVGAGT
jgi:hypothetical protein